MSFEARLLFKDRKTRLHHNVCALGRKRLKPQLQTFDTAIANVYVKKDIFSGGL